MHVLVTDSSDEFARLKLTLGKGLKQVKDRRELNELILKDDKNAVNVVILGSSIEIAIALAMSEELRVAFPTIGVILLRNKIDAAVTARSMGAGIREVVLADDPEAVVTACRKSEDISRRQLQNISQNVSSHPIGKIIAFHSPKDGLGVTTVASNIATDLAHRKGLSVCLVDSSTRFGDLALRFRLDTPKSWLDLLSIQDIDDQVLNAVVNQSKFDLDLLLAPREMTLDSLGQITSFNQVIRALQEKYQYVLIDTDSRLDEWTQNVIAQADYVVVITKLDLSSLKNLKIRVKELAGLDIPVSNMSLYLNGENLEAGIKPEDIPELIGFNISAALPWDNEVTRFSNEGTPIVIAKPRSGISHAFAKATEELIKVISITEMTRPKQNARSRKSA